jgi:hypothetical protein
MSGECLGSICKCLVGVSLHRYCIIYVKHVSGGVHEYLHAFGGPLSPI